MNGIAVQFILGIFLHRTGPFSLTRPVKLQPHCAGMEISLEAIQIFYPYD